MVGLADFESTNLRSYAHGGLRSYARERAFERSENSRDEAHLRRVAAPRAHSAAGAAALTSTAALINTARTGASHTHLLQVG
jgi:hypothetical protein